MADAGMGYQKGEVPSFDPDARWGRVPRWLHRVAHDQVMLAAPGGDQRTLEGLAAVVWVVVDEAGTVDELVERIGELWPDAHPDIGRERVLGALEMLETHDVIRGGPQWGSR